MTKLLISKIDKANHFVVGYLLYIISCFIFSPIVSLIPVVIIAALKEIRDMKAYKRKFDYPDFFYTVAGAIPALILLLIK